MKRMLVVILEILFASTLFLVLSSMVSGKDWFRAAVYEHGPISQTDPKVSLSRKEAIEIVTKNIDIYEQQARIAQKNNTDIIVFPENGLYGYDLTRDTIKPYLEMVPDPEWEHKPWSPCLEPHRHEKSGDIEVLRLLSCLAWNNGMYVVVNMASREFCDALTDPYCPADGQYQYNTNVVFDRDGTLIARYRKYHLYWQPIYDRPPRREVITFNTAFGSFGIFTSGDLLYRRPAFDLVEICRVNSIVVPMTWDNTFPFPLAIEVQQGFAVNMRVNLIVANTVEPRFRIGGSGIYSSRGAIVYHYDRRSFSGKLMMADLPVIPVKQPPFSQEGLRTKIKEQKTLFTTLVSGNEFKFSALHKQVGVRKICDKGFCCHIRYRIDNTRKLSDDFVFGVFNGRHSRLIDLNIQVCGLVKCAGRRASSCGRRTFSSRTLFTSLVMWGSFADPSAVLPFVLLNGMSLGQGSFNYSEGMIYVKSGFSRPVIDVILFGRHFARDPTIIPLPVNRTRPSPSVPETTTTSKRSERSGGDNKRPNSADFFSTTNKPILFVAAAYLLVVFY